MRIHWLYGIHNRVYEHLILLVSCNLLIEGTALRFSCSVVSNSLQLHGLQHARLPCLTISRSLLKLMSVESVMPSNHLIFCRPLLPSCLQSFPALGFFQMSQLFASGGQIIGASTSDQSFQWIFRVWFPLRLTGWISWQSKGLSRVFSSTTV